MAQMSPQDFTTTYGPLADDISKATGLDSSVVLGQAAQETGWGNHVSGNNIFGISPGGKVASYPDTSTAAQAYVDLINRRYAVASKFPNPDQQARAITQLGYNSADKTYADSVVGNAAKVRAMQGNQSAPSADDLMARMKTLAPPSTGAATPDAIPTMTVRSGAANDGAPSADDLLARMKTIAPPAATAAKPVIPSDPELTDSEGHVIDNPGEALKRGAAFAQPVANVASSAIQGARQGFDTGMFPEQPGLREAELQTLYGGNMLARAGAGIGLAGSGVNRLAGAAMGGVTGGITAAGEELPAWMNGRQLARDVNALPEAFGGSPGIFHTPQDMPPPGIRYVPAPARTAAEGNLLANFPRHTDLPAPPNLLAYPPGGDVPTMTVRPGMGGPAPNAAGAEDTGFKYAGNQEVAGKAEMTPEQIAANRHTAEMEWLNKTNQPGVADNRELIPGVNPTLAQREQTVQTAREQKSISQQDTVVSDEERALADAHNQTRSDYYKQPDLAGSTVLLKNGEKAASDKIEAGLANAFANKTEANAQPVVDLIDQTLGGRSGKRAAVSSEVNSVRSRLFDADGNLETDPEILYGVREHINDVLSKENQRQNPVSARAQSILIKMRDKLDDVIEPAAPGFKAAIDGYAEDMKPLDVMRALKESESGLFDSLGRMQFSRVHSLMRDVIDARQPGAALSPFQHITDEQMTKLQNLHDDLKRVASSEDLARAKGSDTAQSLFDASKSAVKGVVVRAANMAPVLGPALRRSSEAYAPIAEARAANKLRQRGLEMLHPPPNLLQPPLP
jgi:Mannosyl-glycoprotein endo-beta-N-acetylglucosaminidase